MYQSFFSNFCHAAIDALQSPNKTNSLSPPLLRRHQQRNYLSLCSYHISLRTLQRFSAQATAAHLSISVNTPRILLASSRQHRMEPRGSESGPAATRSSSYVGAWSGGSILFWSVAGGAGVVSAASILFRMASMQATRSNSCDLITLRQ